MKKNMKMFNNLSTIFSFLAVLMLLMLACNDEENYPALKLDNSTAPSVTLSHLADSITETYTYITVSSTMDGRIYYVSLPAGSIAPTASELILGKTSSVAGNIDDVANKAYMVKLKGLESAAKYDLYAVSVNSEEGKYGEVVGPVSIQCPDNTTPYIKEMSPAIHATKVPKNISQIVLTFNEPVQLKDVSKIAVVDDFDESPLDNIGKISVSGSNVIIPVTGDFENFANIAVLIHSGALVDKDGHGCDDYLTDAENKHVLLFSIVDFIDVDLFDGVYHCVANEVRFGDGPKKYDVIIKAIKDGSDFYFEVQNINDWTGVLYMDVDPIADTCYFTEQATGMTYGSEDILISSLDTNNIASADFKPGNFAHDGSEIKVYGQIYISLGYFGSYEFTFTKADANTARIITGESLISDAELKK
jgi:hypothetical protein